jgi:protocatechuate 3,4-dioxygenase beta subunit
MTKEQGDRTTSRRGFLASGALGAGGLAVAALARPTTATDLDDATSCLTLTPTEEVGPFYVAYDHVRRNIRAGQTGIHLRLHVRVIDVSTCKPVHNAALDVWQANALGVYSDEPKEGTSAKRYLRGLQLTDKHGRAVFHTIMPGWYQGRVEHIHVKVRRHGTITDGVYSGGTTAHVGQMFFPQHVNDACAVIAAYASNQQDRITNSTDRVYTKQSGSECRLKISGSTSNGYVGRITLGIKRARATV